jgi:sporulation protein YlmC with PRC-barrel domain
MLRRVLERTVVGIIQELSYKVPAGACLGTKYAAHTARGISHLEELFMGMSATTSDAIRAKTVIGTSVKDPTGNKIGNIEDIVLDKLSNNIVFAIVGFGGFLGMGEKYHPIPWSSLKYDEREGGYMVNFSKEQLQAAPADSIDALVAGNAVAYRNKTYDYYKAPRYW